MKKRTALSLAVSMAISYPVSLQALGLGELHSSSQLNQPLNAQIDLLSTSAQEAGQLQVRLASPDVFSRVGIDRPDYLSSLKFSPTMVNGKPVIRVTSNQPISEPFLNFLLEVSWPQGQLLKEYTVLLDPPVLMQAGNATADNTATVRAEPNATGVVNRGQEADRQNQLAQQQRQRQIEIQSQQQAQAAQRALQEQRAFEAQAQAVINEPTPTARAASSGGSKYRVKRGDTMSRVASRLRYRGVSNNQMMVALFRANPHAFANENINYLKSGSLLTRPPKSDVTSQSSAETRQIVRQHYAQWKKFRSGLAAKTTPQKAVPQGSDQQASTSSTSGSNKANLKVAGSSSDGVASNQVSAVGSEEQRRQLTLAQEALASSKSENAELQSRLGKLEAIIRKKDRLINLKNDHLAKLEAQLSTLSGGTAVIPAAPIDEAPEPVNEQADLARQVGNEAELNSNKIIRGAEEATAEQQASMDTNDKATATNLSGNEDAEAERLSEGASPFAVDDSEKKGGILDILTSPLVAAIGGGSLLALLLGWLLMRRSSSTTEPEEEMIVEDFKPAEDDFADDLDTDSPVLDDDFDGFGGNTGFDEEPAMETRFEETQEHKDEVAESEDAFDSILTGDDTIEDDEILQEADVYIVYGLHEQAEEELKKAINDNPAKLEYRYKLLENYKAAGQSDKFIDTAKDFLAAEGDNKQQLWDKITTWGKEVAPENDMFSESSAVSAAGVIAGAAGLGAAAKVAQEAFADDDLASDFEASLDSADIDLGSDDDLQISGLDSKDFELDLDDDFGLDELAGELEASDFEASGNVLSFGASAAAKAESEAPTNVSLEIDQDSGLDKVLPSGSSYVTNDSDSTDEGSDDEFDDALSFLDLSDDEEMQEAHIGTKLDLARAYLDMGDVEGARCTLEEVVIEGNDDQKREAEELLQQTG